MLYFNLIIFSLIVFVSLIITYIEWNKLVSIYHNNHSFFDLFFIFIYPFENAIFLFLYFFDNIENRELWVSRVVLVILFAVAVDKFLLKKQNEEVIGLCLEKQQRIIDDTGKIIIKLKQLLKFRENEKEQLINYIQKKLK